MTFAVDILFLLLLMTLLTASSVSSSPNIVFILTDDQDVALGGLTPLKHAKKFLADEGITFSNAFATTPLCCPSRASILTGFYPHSHGTVNNSLSGGCSSPHWQKSLEPKTFGAVLHDVGYRTFYAGKYLNQYGHARAGGVAHVPRGWDWWIGLDGNSAYYNYTLSVNGTGTWRGYTDSDYLTDVLKEYSLEFLKNLKEPFLMVVSTPAPHEPFIPASRHKGTFSRVKALRTPSFNIPVNNTKHWLLRIPPDVLPPETVNRVDEVFRSRWESLLAVDELIESLASKLKELRVLANTYVVLSSDHGFHMGQFGMPWDKRQPYETDVRVPLLMRGPGIPKLLVEDPVLNIDLAATFLDMAGVSSRGFGDGKSFLPLVNSVSYETRRFLLEYWGEGERKKSPCYEDPNVKACCLETSCKCFDARNNTFMCLRRVGKDVDDVFCEFEDSESFVEFYDIRKDPEQMNNLAQAGNFTLQKKMLDCCRLMVRMRKPLDSCSSL